MCGLRKIDCFKSRFACQTSGRRCCMCFLLSRVRDSVVGIATRYVLEGRGSNSGASEIFHIRPDRSWGPHIFLYSGYRVSFPRVKRPPHLAPRLRKSGAIPLLPLWVFVACYRANCTFYVIIYLSYGVLYYAA